MPVYSRVIRHILDTLTSIGMVQMLMVMDLAMMNMGSQNLVQMGKIVI